MKGDSIMKIDFIPIDYADIRHSKTSFKKLMRACVPSSTNNEPEHSFYKLVFHLFYFRIFMFELAKLLLYNTL